MQKYKRKFQERAASTIMDGLTSVNEYEEQADYDEDLMWDIAERDRKGAIENLKDRLIHDPDYGLSKRETNQLRFKYLKVTDADSGNWTHANIYHNIQISGPEEIINRIETVNEM